MQRGRQTGLAFLGVGNSMGTAQRHKGATTSCPSFLSDAQFSRKPVFPIADFQAGSDLFWSGSFFPQKAPLKLTALNGGDDYPKGISPLGQERTQT